MENAISTTDINNICTKMLFFYIVGDFEKIKETYKENPASAYEEFRKLIHDMNTKLYSPSGPGVKSFKAPNF